MAELKSLVYEDNYNFPEGAIRISPSSIYKFNDKKWLWFQEQIKGIRESQGNTSTVLGTIVHRIAEVYIKQALTSYKLKEEIETYLNSITDKEIDKDFIREQYPAMGNALVSHMQGFGVPEIAEEVISYEIKPNIFVAGTADARLNDTILIDHKTTSRMSSDFAIPQYIKLQLLTYAWIYEKNGIHIDIARVHWITNNNVGRVSPKTGKPLKDYPTKVIPTSYLITDDDMKFIDDYLHLIAETIQKYQEDPSLAYLLFSDYRLKEANINVKSDKVFN